ncbi:hypothetical protein BDY21DRAFT_131462 [Lineolata rhizophorae]|uniref:BHLH domain-containing protein n=1 Tax=Lineolata rhizophorae TaxID=578093 RepID=A0A6A6PA60_9PEZI|nr:hypothetical protein BDY21DRAFT_131462 [Lineolata rhizophorae]
MEPLRMNWNMQAQGARYKESARPLGPRPSDTAFPTSPFGGVQNHLRGPDGASVANAKLDDWLASEFCTDDGLSDVRLQDQSDTWTPCGVDPEQFFSPQMGSFIESQPSDSSGSASPSSPLFSDIGSISPAEISLLPPALDGFFEPPNDFASSLESLPEASEGDSAAVSPDRPQSHRNAAVATASQAEEPAKRRRGRPRLPRPSPGAVSRTPDKDHQHSSPRHRVPHTQVERKYRENLNAELERLRGAIPMLPCLETGGPSSRPSKATVLAAAIQYIGTMEARRDQMLAELERLRGLSYVDPARPTVGW